MDEIKFTSRDMVAFVSKYIDSDYFENYNWDKEVVEFETYRNRSKAIAEFTRQYDLENNIK